MASGTIQPCAASEDYANFNPDERDFTDRAGGDFLMMRRREFIADLASYFTTC